MLSWANQFNICCFLDNHQYNFHPHNYECLLAAGVQSFITANSGNALKELEKFSTGNHWLFGHFAYDLKNEIEQLHSAHDDHICFPDLFFFIPQYVIVLSQSELLIAAPSFADAETVYHGIVSVTPEKVQPHENIAMASRFSLEEYQQTVASLQKHIHEGDCYEVNFCQEFFAVDQHIDPVASYTMLSEVSPHPFGAFYKIEDKYLLCGSPERYLKKTGDKLLSQPMKGTWKRDTGNPDIDEMNRQYLRNSSKERSENVMVVDLVRNDLSKVCVEGSVTVDELFGIYSFPQVHQMISTVSGQLKKEVRWTDIIRASFPMGSMTGAPKKKVMELIEKYERTRRGIFSGAVGYRTPDGDFDFNVVIRSILYNETNRYVSCQVGSGITFYSDPAKEYEECLLKLQAIKKVLA